MIIDNIEFVFSRKKIKHLRLTVKSDKVNVSVPFYMKEEDVMRFIYSKLEKIKKHINKCSYVKEITYQDGETVFLWGKPYKLNVVLKGKNRCFWDNDSVIVIEAKNDSLELKKRVFDAFCKKELKKQAEKFLELWQIKTDIKTSEMRIKKMKTRWGSCNIKAKRIWLNLKLVHYDDSCLSYVVLHEILHLIEKGHNKRFYALLNKYYPQWKEACKMLNSGYGQLS